jgi:ribulose-phosphate 3-epimerase
VQFIKEQKAQAGVSVNPATPVQELEDILHDLDMVLVMSVNPGFGGQSFIPHSLEKIRQLRKMISHRNLSTAIEVDGGIKLENAKTIAQSGADILVMGSGFFDAGDYSMLMSKLNESLGN